MARGWESKSVESQIESAQSQPRAAIRATLTEAQLKRLREREILTLSRTRVSREMESSRNPRYLELLTRELQAIEQQLQKLG